MVLMVGTAPICWALAVGPAAPGPRAPIPAPAPSSSAVPTGQEAWARVVGNTIQGGTRDGDYTEFFDTAGTVRHLDRDGNAEGRWKVRGDLVCLLFPDDDEEECRRIEVVGPNGAFIDSDGTRYGFTILPGNPNRL